MKQTDKHSVMIGILAGLAILFTGCSGSNRSSDDARTSISREQQTDAASLRRFHNISTEEPTAVESAIELSKKYAALSDLLTRLKEEKQALVDENKKLKARLATLEPELAQANKELTEANDLLVEMRVELNNWKTNVLGFRDEMRNADKAQLETLLKILTVLGGEVKDVSPEQVSSAQEALEGDENS